MDNEQIAYLLERTTAAADTLAPALGIPAPAVAAVQAIGAAVVHLLRSSDVTTEQLIARLHKVQPLVMPWSETAPDLPVADFRDDAREPEHEHKPAKRAKKSTD